jgi:hypothetical protein
MPNNKHARAKGGSKHASRKETSSKNLETAQEKYKAELELIEIEKAFHAFDQAGDGALDAKDIYRKVKHHGLRVRLEVVEEIVKDVDVDGSGAIELGEFKQLMLNPPDAESNRAVQVFLEAAHRERKLQKMQKRAAKNTKDAVLTYIYPKDNLVPHEPRWWVAGHQVPSSLTLQRPDLKTAGTSKYLMGFRGKQGKRRTGARPGTGPFGVLSEQHLSEWPNIAPQVARRKRRQALRAAMIKSGKLPGVRGHSTEG